MDTLERLASSALIGAGGKMGRGIALLLLKEIAQLPPPATLYLMDHSAEALEGTISYLRHQLEKRPPQEASSPEAYATQCLERVVLCTSLKELAPALLVFEAAPENLELKASIYRELKRSLSPDCFYLTNTSSIPISVLNKQAPLDDKIIGYHFYNPPPVQKLLELIYTKTTNPALIELGKELATRLKKQVVISHDIAGFIGNGFFMRDLLYACRLVDKLTSSYSTAEALYIVNTVSQQGLIRPMGIFQLADYVGVDVCLKILHVMGQYIDEDFSAPLLESMPHQGGQYPDGSQKDGILQYSKGMPIAVFDPVSKVYLTTDHLSLPDAIKAPIWKEVIQSPEKDSLLHDYFSGLGASESITATLIKDYLHNSNHIAHQLVEQGVAENVGDVNTVMTAGFYHAYGPANDYIEVGAR